MKGGAIILRAEQRIVEYDILRVIATLLVVLSHCTYYKISTDFGGCDYSNLAGNLSIMFRIVQEVTI